MTRNIRMPQPGDTITVRLVDEQNKFHPRARGVKKSDFDFSRHVVMGGCSQPDGTIGEAGWIDQGPLARQELVNWSAQPEPRW